MPLRSLRTKLLAFWIAFAAFLVAVTHLVTFRAALDAQFQQLRQTLLAIAATSALQIDGEAHAAIPPTSSSVRLPAYQALVQQLRAIRRANPSIRYVYTMVPSNAPGRWHYLGDADERKPSLPGDPYDASRYPAMLAGLHGPSADPALTYDEWGALLSGYAPIRVRDGKAVGVMGIDMSGEYVVRTQQALRRWWITVLGFSFITVVGLGVVLAQWVSRPLRALVSGIQRIGHGELTHRVPVQSRDEVGIVAEAFNHMARRLADSLKELQEHALSTIQSLSLALEAKDRYTRGHSERVQRYAAKIGKQLGLPSDALDILQRFTALHDLGKIGVKEEILLKPGKLTPEEFDVIKTHPEVGYKILLPLKLPTEALELVRHHHERLDGQGYPHGLAGEQIPRLVAIVSVADAFDAMTGHRPYRQSPMTFAQAAQELRRCSGTQFHPNVVEALLDVLRHEGKLPSDG